MGQTDGQRQTSPKHHSTFSRGITSILPQAVSPSKGDCLHSQGNVVGTHFQMPFPIDILSARNRNVYYYRLKDGLSHGLCITLLAAIFFEKSVRNVYAICCWHALSDAISNKNFGRTKNKDLPRLGFDTFTQAVCDVVLNLR